MLALSADRALMVLPAASEAMRAALWSEDLLNIGILVACQRPKWDSSTTLLQPPNDFKDARAGARVHEYPGGSLAVFTSPRGNRDSQRAPNSARRLSSLVICGQPKKAARLQGQQQTRSEAAK